MFWWQKTHPPRLPDFIIEGFRITLRPPRIDDYLAWKKIRTANKEFLTPFEPTWPKDCLSEVFFKRRIKRQIKNWVEDRGYPLLIFSNDGDLIGGMNINNICRGSAYNASLGYWIAQEHQGLGLMSEALRLTIQYCFEELYLHRINASCLLHNERSKKLVLRAGFSEEGMAKKYLKIDGRWQDHYLFGLTIEDWEQSISSLREGEANEVTHS